MFKRRRWSTLASLLVVLGGAFVYFVRMPPQAEACDWSVDLAAVRALAASQTGQLPLEVRTEQITEFSFPEAAVVAGAPWVMSPMAVYSYQVVFPDRSIVIDTGLTESDAKAVHVSSYDSAAWERLSRAMDKASAIYATHEHSDHLGGLVSRLSSPHVLEVARITSVQRAHPENLEPAKIQAAEAEKLTPFAPGSLEAIAPGVVLIQAGGHTPGSQLVYLRLASGSELLLLGDVAWHQRNLEEARSPPRLVGMITRSDVRRVSCQLSALRDLRTKEPQLIAIPGHDRPFNEGLIARGILVRGFQ